MARSAALDRAQRVPAYRRFNDAQGGKAEDAVEWAEGALKKIDEA